MNQIRCLHVKVQAGQKGQLRLLLIKLLLQCRKTGHGLCSLHQLYEHCIRPYVLDIMTLVSLAARHNLWKCGFAQCAQGINLLKLFWWFAVASLRLHSQIFCLWLVDLGRKTLHTNQHSPARYGGRPVHHSAIRGDAHETCFPPWVREQLVRKWTLHIQNSSALNCYIYFNILSLVLGLGSGSPY